jgi:hypothetical protein
MVNKTIPYIPNAPPYFNSFKIINGSRAIIITALIKGYRVKKDWTMLSMIILGNHWEHWKGLFNKL